MSTTVISFPVPDATPNTAASAAAETVLLGMLLAAADPNLSAAALRVLASISWASMHSEGRPVRAGITAICTATQLSRSTVRAAVTTLRARNYIRVRGGSPTSPRTFEIVRPKTNAGEAA